MRPIPGNQKKPRQPERLRGLMEMPSSHAGVVKELKVKLGDKVAMGSLVLLLESADVAATPVQAQSSETKQAAVPVDQAQAATNVAAPASAMAAPAAASFTGTADQDCDLLVLGAGPGDGIFWRRTCQAGHCCGRGAGFPAVRGLFRGAIFCLMWLKCLSVNGVLINSLCPPPSFI